MSPFFKTRDTITEQQNEKLCQVLIMINVEVSYINKMCFYLH